MFDELIANAYRSMNPASYTSTLWDNLLITGGWRIRLIDHVRAFRTSRQLEYPESLAQCDRTLLARLRALSPVASRRQLGRFLNPDQLDALEARRTLIVRHFDERIAREGEQAVLYDIRRPAGAESGGTLKINDAAPSVGRTAITAAALAGPRPEPTPAPAARARPCASACEEWTLART